jgi:hypothetical protein
MDTDYVNGTVLLQGTFSEADERETVLGDVNETFRVSSGGSAVEGTWIPLNAARLLASRYPTALGHLTTFLDDGLGGRFPAPIPEMRLQLRAALSSSSNRAVPYGFPAFQDTVGCEERSVSPRPPVTVPVSVPVGAKKPVGRPKGRRTSGASPVKQMETVRDSSPEEEQVRSSGRKTRRGAK